MESLSQLPVKFSYSEKIQLNIKCSEICLKSRFTLLRDFWVENNRQNSTFLTK